jgi:hypothetical protein
MTDPTTALRALGWRIDQTHPLSAAVRDFQRGWNLGAALAVDGNAGPATRAALELSYARNQAGKPDFSPSFSAREFRCPCQRYTSTGFPWADCPRIWMRRGAVIMAERFRSLVGPFTPDRACRCPRENARVGGVSTSQHLYGNALDVPVYAVTVEQVKALGVVSGIGYYVSSTGRAYPRHIDTRHLGDNTTGSTVARPAVWNYGALRSTPLTPRPGTTTPLTDWSDMATRDEIKQAFREVLAERDTARKLFTGHNIMVDPDNPTGDRVTPSTVIEKAATYAKAAATTTEPEVTS